MSGWPFKLTSVIALLFPVICAEARQQVPTIAAILHGASRLPKAISPGSLVLITGSNLGPVDPVRVAVDDPSGVPLVLAGVQVSFDSFAAPLISVSDKEILAVVPFGIADSKSTNISVIYQANVSEPRNVEVAQAAPGILSVDDSGFGQAFLLNADGSKNGIDNPAAPGDSTTVFVTGLGLTDPPTSDGVPNGEGLQTTQAISATVGGMNADVTWAGSAPGRVAGYYIVTIVIPPNIANRGTYALVITAGGVSSQPNVTVAVSGPEPPIPSTPNQLKATVLTSDRIDVSWESSDSFASQYRLERRTVPQGEFQNLAIVDAPAMRFTDQSIAVGLSYEYRIRSENVAGNSDYSIPAPIMVPVPANPPGSLNVTAVGSTSIRLAWDGANTNATAYEVERRLANSEFQLLATVLPPNSSMLDSGLAPSTIYFYRVRSIGAYGPTSYAPEASIATLDPPAPSAPTLQASLTTPTQASLVWNTDAAGITRFRLERRKGTEAYSEIGQPGEATRGFTDSGLLAATGYNYRIRVETATGISAYSNEAKVSTPEPPPPAPSLLGTVMSATTIRLTWTSAATGIVRFRLERRGATGPFAEIAQPGPTARLVDDVGLQPETSYVYRLRAEGVAGSSAYSNEAPLTTNAIPILPPTNFAGSPASSTQVNLSWVNPTGSPVRIHIERSSANGYVEIAALAAGNSAYQDAGLTPSTTYYYRIRAEASSRFSAYTPPVSTTTLARPPLTVFLVHGNRESGMDDSWKLGRTLLDPQFGISVPSTVNWGFSWPCAKASASQCGGCTISAGAMALARYIIDNSPPGGRIVVIGHSMGGLLARDMILNNWYSVFSSRTLSALITLGTPNVGYPYVEGLDSAAVCQGLGSDMWSDYRIQQSQNVVIQSQYLFDLNQRWGATTLSSQPLPWLAAAGTFCANTIRSSINPVGCPDNSPRNDGLVCDLSASFRLNVPGNRPTVNWSSAAYAHTTSMLGTRYVSGPTVLCTTESLLYNYIPLFDPPASSDLVRMIRNLINGL